MFLPLAPGLNLWVFGVINKLLPLIVTNIAAFVLIFALMAMKVNFDRAHTID
jgi:hypothetical protein